MGINTTLHKLGLNEHEAALYVAGITIGPSMASMLSKQSGVERVMTYHSLKSLQEKGLVSATGPAKKTIFTMEPPSELRAIIERRKQELDALGAWLLWPHIKQFRTWKREHRYEYDRYIVNVMGGGGALFQLSVFLVLLPIKFYLLHNYWPYPWWWDSVLVLVLFLQCMATSFICVSIRTYATAKKSGNTKGE